MAVQWEVGKCTRACAVTGREFAEGDVFFSALREEGDTFVRSDYSPEAWASLDTSDVFSFWRTRFHTEEENKPRRLVIDVEAFYTFFASLDEADSRQRQLFRYLVGLILTRKRILRLDEIEKGPDGDTLLLYDRRAEKTVHVFAPEATGEELAEVQEQLNQIFECQVGVEDL